MLVVAITTIVTGTGHRSSRQTLAPHELNNGDAPPAIIREPPSLHKGNINLESAEQKDLRAVVITTELHQPWSLAFLPDGAILVTERSGELRMVRNGKLGSSSVAGVPAVQTGGPRGLQGLMDIALHPKFNENKWVPAGWR
jgi:glucose/arabinose dehydrogenase